MYSIGLLDVMVSPIEEFSMNGGVPLVFGFIVVVIAIIIFIKKNK